MKLIKTLVNDFKSGKSAKPDFIHEMHQVHQFLFEYAEVIKGTDISKIEIKDDQVIMTTRELGIKMICDKDDERVIPLEMINFGEFEGDEQRCIKKIIKNGWTVFDVGANIGWYSMNLAKSFNDLKIVAFEPVPSTFNYLEANISLNEINNIEIKNLGLSDTEGAKDMYIYREGMGNASLSDLSERESVEKIQTQFTTLDKFADQHGLAPNFIKCDVEGAELFVFRGAVETLKKHKPVVFTEMLRKWSSGFGYHPNDIIDLFSGLDYECYTIDQGKLKKFGRVDDDTVETNYIFIHRDKSAVYQG